ncbi:MAG TPA: DUF1810 domain-containing protein [Ramlibacter sp.]
MHDAWNLKRFVDAQEPVIGEVLLELERGHKRTHWMWFMFPQHVALGLSATAKHFGIHSLEEAREYLDHAVLGPRLKHCCEILMKVEGRTAHEIFGSPDDLKLRSCLTLFELAAPGEAIFANCLDKYYAGRRDERTITLCPAPLPH